MLHYAELADRAGRADRVLGHLVELTAREPLNEKACARLMVTLAALGQQAAALHAYEQLRLRLDEQLGVLPGPELARAHLRVLRQQIPAAGDADPHARAVAGHGERDGGRGNGADRVAAGGGRSGGHGADRRPLHPPTGR